MNHIRTVLAAVLLSVASWGAWAGEPIDINTASAAELAQAMKGVGPNKAEAIILYRKENGPFKRVEDLARVRGIGKRTLEMNRDILGVGNVTAAN